MVAAISRVLVPARSPVRGRRPSAQLVTSTGSPLRTADARVSGLTSQKVAAPSSTVNIDLLSRQHAASLSCDGRRSLAVPSGASVQVRKGAQPIRIARLPGWNFTDRLVSKFQLPVRSLREASPPSGED